MNMSIGYPKVVFSVILFLVTKHSFSSPYIQNGHIKKPQETKQTQTNKKTCSNLPHSQNKQAKEYPSLLPQMRQ